MQSKKLVSPPKKFVAPSKDEVSIKRMNKVFYVALAVAVLFIVYLLWS